MHNFSVFNPTKILFGKGCIQKIAHEIPKNARVLITYGGGSVVQNGTLDEVKTALTGFTLFEFGGIEPNPTYETLMNAVLLAREQKITFLLAVGGGSVIDGTKFIATAIPFAGDAWDIIGKRDTVTITEAVPLGAVLTLPATGSEMNHVGVISNKETTDKLSFRNNYVFPKFSALDPEKSFSLPKRQVGNGLVDAFMHVTEQYLTYPVNAKVQDRFAEGLLLTLIEEGQNVLQEPNNYDTRANIMWAATWAINGFIGAGVPHDWASHGISHEITALYGLDHAQALAILFPAILEVQRADKHEKLLQYAERVWNITEGSEEERIDQAIFNTRQFFEKMGVPTYFSAYQLGVEIIPKIIEQLKRHGLNKLGERGTLTLERVQKVLELAL